MARLQCTTVIKRDRERPSTIGWWVEPNMSVFFFQRGAVCRRRNYKLDLNKQTAAAWPPLQELFGGCCSRCLLAFSCCSVQAQSQQSAHRHVLYRVHNSKPCYHARPHMHCILPNDNSSKRINIYGVHSDVGRVILAVTAYGCGREDFSLGWKTRRYKYRGIVKQTNN